MEQFTIRPMPAEGESLSSFLDRACMENQQKMYPVLRYLAKDGVHVLQRNSGHRLDTFPERLIDFDKLASLCGITEADIHRMSLSVLKKKIYDDPDEGTGSAMMTSMTISKDKRYYCPDCLRENGIYKLVWQVNEIEMCDKHQTRLTIECPSCEKSQPYMGLHMSEHKCHHCGESLIHRGDKVPDDGLISKQMRRWRSWLYLLYSDQSFVSQIHGYTNEQSCILLLACLERQLGIQVFSKRHRYSMLYHVAGRSQKNSTGRRFSIEQLFNALDKFGLSVDQFSQISVWPNSINDILRFNQEHRTIGPCLSPWCPSNGTSDAMVQINRGKGTYLHCVCTRCFMEFGYKNGDDTWYEVVGAIPLIQDKIIPLAELNLPYKEIGRLLRVDYRKAIEVLAYLAHVCPELSTNKLRFSSIEIPSNIVDCFQTLTMETIQVMKMYRKARDLYGWTQSEFFYYLASPNVQMYMHIECPRKNGRNKGAADKWHRLVIKELSFMEREQFSITAMAVAARLGCNIETLKKPALQQLISEARRTQRTQLLKIEEAFLRNQIHEYIENCEARGESVFRSTIRQQFRLPKSVVDYKFPGMYEWISEQIELHKERMRIHSVEHYKELADWVMPDLWNEFGTVCVSWVAKRIGIAHSTLIGAYPEVIAYIKAWSPIEV